MEKTKYMQPSVTVVKLSSTLALLAGSTDENYSKKFKGNTFTDNDTPWQKSPWEEEKK